MTRLDRDRFNLIPCGIKSKRPTIEWKEFQEKQYKGEIQDNGNYAVICGRTSNCVVIDIDSPELIRDLFDNWALIREKTLVVQTGRGGYHVYVAPENNTFPRKMSLTNDKGQHIDIQSQGAYVLGPGSIHENGTEYKIISSDKKIMKMNLDGFIKGLQRFGFNTESSGLLPFQEIAKGNIGKGQRNSSAFKYAANLLDNVEMDEQTAWAELKRWNGTLSPPLDESELKSVYKSAVSKVKRKLKEEVKKEPEGLILMRDITSAKEGELITFKCFVGAMDEYKTVFTSVTCVCPVCGNSINVRGNGYENPSIPTCTECNRKLIVRDEGKVTNDVRTVMLQEPPEETVKNRPIRFEARVRDENVHQMFIGEKKIATGTFKSKPTKDNTENDIVIEITGIVDLEENKAECLSPDEFNNIVTEVVKNEFFDNVASSFSPEIYGYEEIKKSIILTLIGGGNTRRCDINMMVLGNPGKAKSELLKFANKLCKSSYVNGRMATGAGIGYGMVKMPNGTQIPQAGPLILNNNGFVLIDELDKMKKEDRSALLECMEQQSISLAKAGVSATIQAKTAIIAAANPKYGTWDSETSFKDNINLETFLLSRFDIIWGIISNNPILRRKIAHHIVTNTSRTNEVLFDTSTLRRYINSVKSLSPELSQEAGEYLESYYSHQCDVLEDMNKEFLAMEERQLEGLIRLATAHAKMKLKETVDIEDVKVVIELFKASLHSFGIKTDSDGVQSTFNDRPTTKDQAIMREFEILAGEHKEGHVSREILQGACVRKQKHLFPDVYSFTKFFKNYEGSTFLLCPDGLYKKSIK